MLFLYLGGAATIRRIFEAPPHWSPWGHTLGNPHTDMSWHTVAHPVCQRATKGGEVG